MRFFATFLPLVLLIPFPTQADPEFVSSQGYCFAPVCSSTIRMSRAIVDIDFGERFSDDSHNRRVRTNARFHMQNDDLDTVAVDVGFPVRTMWLDGDESDPVNQRMAKALQLNDKYGMYDFLVSIDGGPVFEPSPTIVRGAFDSWLDVDHLWYGWEMTFPPGETVVDVEFQMWTNSAISGVLQTTSYSLAPGRFWRDNIDEVVVTVHLPTENGESVLGSSWPPYYTQNDNVLRWRCTDCKPDVHDYVVAGFVPPEVISELRSLERREKDDPDDVDILWELVNKYLYAANKNGPAAGDYPDFAKLAEIRLDRLVEIDPSNCEAWQLYLQNYYRMRRYAFGTSHYDRFEIRDRQRLLIEEAYDNCPEAEDIRLWHKLIMEERWEPLENFGFSIREYHGEPRIVVIDSGRRRMPYLSPREEKILARYYKRTESENGKGVYTLKSKRLSARDRWRILRILEMRGFYRYESTDSLRQYYDRQR